VPHNYRIRLFFSWLYSNRNHDCSHLGAVGCSFWKAVYMSQCRMCFSACISDTTALCRGFHPRSSVSGNSCKWTRRCQR